METELKLKIADADIGRIHAHQLLATHAQDGPSEYRLSDTYFDTAKFDLWRHGITLRVREEDAAKGGTSWVQTVKTADASSASLHERGEWESVLASAVPHPTEIARQVKSERIAKLLRSSTVRRELRPVFTSTTQRTLWHLELPDGQVVECSLDAGQIHCGDRTEAIVELEFELKKGNPTQLFDLALALHEDVPLQLVNSSKAARGFALLESYRPQPVKAAPVHLRARMSLEDAFRAMGLNCLEQVEANLPGVLAASAESLHQMRVGLRRLRAVLAMFDALAPVPSDVGETVEWLAGELGATRDWDVLTNATLNEMTGCEADETKRLAQIKASELHQQLLMSLDDRRYTALLLQLNRWFRGRQWRAGLGIGKRSPLSANVMRGMTPLLEKAQKRLHRRIDADKQGDAAAHHRTRIAAKKARYAVEFFSDVLPRRAAKRYIATVSRLQDKLGTLNDLEVAKGLLSELNGATSSPAVMFASGYVNAQLQRGLHGSSGVKHEVRRMKMPVGRG